MVHISVLDTQVLQGIFHFLEWSHIVNLLCTRDRRMTRLMARDKMFKHLVFDRENEQELPWSFSLLRGIRGLESVTLCATLGGAQRLLPLLVLHSIKKMVIECSLHDGTQLLGMKHFMSPLFAVCVSADASIVVPCLNTIFPDLQSLVLRTSISFLFNCPVPAVNSVTRLRDPSTDYQAIFFSQLREKNFLSIEMDYPTSVFYLSQSSLTQLPPSLTKLHLRSKIDTTQLCYNLHLANFGIVLPDLLDLEVIMPYSKTSISLDDDSLIEEAKLSEAPIDDSTRPVYRCFPPKLSKLSLCLGNTFHYGTIALPDHLESLSLSAMRGRLRPLIFGLGNLFSPTLPASLTELKMQQLSIMVGSDKDWDHRNDGRTLQPLPIPASVRNFALSQGDFTPTFSFRTHWPQLHGLRYLTVFDFKEGDAFRYSHLAKVRWNLLPNLTALDIGSTPITHEHINNYPSRLTSLHANYDSFRTLTELVARLKECRFGKCRFPIYADDLTAIYNFSESSSSGNPQLQTEMDLLAHCTQMLECRVDHVDLQFAADKPLTKRAGEYFWKETEEPIFHGPCEAPELKSVVFTNPATYRTSRVSLHTHFFNPSLYTHQGLQSLVFETKTPLTSRLMRALPSTLNHFDSKATPIHEPLLDLSDIPIALETLSIGAIPISEVTATFKRFRKKGLKTLFAPHIMFEPEDLVYTLSGSEIKKLRMMISSSSTDDALSKLAREFQGKDVDWQIYGTIFLSGKLLPSYCEMVDYELLLSSSRGLIDPANLHTSNAVWRPASTITLPAKVTQAIFNQAQLLKLSSIASNSNLSSPIPSPNSSPISNQASNKLIPQSTPKASLDFLAARCPIIIGPNIRILQIQSTKALDIGGYLYCLPASLRHLTLEVPVTFARDNSLWNAPVSQISAVTLEKSIVRIPEALLSFELCNTDPTAIPSFDLKYTPKNLHTLILRDNCKLIPPLDARWSHSSLTHLKFHGGSPWTDAHALYLQSCLPRDTKIEISVVGFTGVLSNRAALHMTWNTMLKDAVTALPRVTVAVFDLHITASMSLDLAKATQLRSLHLDPNGLERPLVVRSEKSTIEFLQTPSKRAKLSASASSLNPSTNESTSSPSHLSKSSSDMTSIASPTSMDVSPTKPHEDTEDHLVDKEANPYSSEPQLNASGELMLQESREENVTPTSFLVAADAFHINRLPSPLPSSLQELEVSNNDEFFPHFRLDHIQNLYISHLVRLVLNIPIRIHERLGDLLPRTLVTLSLTKATEEPSGLPVIANNLPPHLMYFNLPQLLVHRSSAKNFPEALKLLKVANSDQLYVEISSLSPDFAYRLWPNGPPDPPIIKDRRNPFNRSAGNASAGAAGNSGPRSPFRRSASPVSSSSTTASSSNPTPAAASSSSSPATIAHSVPDAPTAPSIPAPTGPPRTASFAPRAYSVTLPALPKPTSTGGVSLIAATLASSSSSSGHSTPLSATLSHQNPRGPSGQSSSGQSSSGQSSSGSVVLDVINLDSDED